MSRRRPPAKCRDCLAPIQWLWVRYGAGYRPFETTPTADHDALVKYGGRALDVDDLAEELHDEKYAASLPRYARHRCDEHDAALSSEEIRR